MKIILSNGAELNPLMVTGASRYVQGANRDCLTFVFDGKTASLDELDSVFSEANCESINIVDGEAEAVHTGYTIRAELKKVKEVTEPETLESEAVTVLRVHVSMAQRTYVETKLTAMNEEITNAQLALCELYEGGIA